MNTNHPPEISLALFASGDAGPIEQWRIERHVRACAECRETVAQYSALRSEITESGAPEDVSWNKLAAEMRANIRLGLAAGECVREADAAEIEPSPLFNTARAVLAFAGVFTLVVTGLVLERPTPTVHAAEPTAQAIQNGIQVSAGEQGFGLMHKGASGVINIATTRGIGARYMDPQTGLVTMTKVDVE